MKSALCLLLMFGMFVPPSTAQSGQRQTDEPAANPARPTASNPATLTPVGNVQFETGVLGGSDSSEFSTRYEWNEVIKLAVSRRLDTVERHYTPFVKELRDRVRVLLDNGSGLESSISVAGNSEETVTPLSKSTKPN